MDEVAHTKDANTTAAPAVTLPEGGGAIGGIGEKFAANAVTGTGSMSVPIYTSPGVLVSVDNFRFPSILVPVTPHSGLVGRQTDKGLPQYLDRRSDEPGSDVFIISRAEDPYSVFRPDVDGSWIASTGRASDSDGFWARDPDGQSIIHEDELDGFLVHLYRRTRLERKCLPSVAVTS